jgi:hypothetical protein
VAHDAENPAQELVVSVEASLYVAHLDSLDPEWCWEVATARILEPPMVVEVTAELPPFAHGV